jgi:uncharacterized protein
MEWHDLLAGLGILIGLIGIVVVVVPGLLIIVGSIWLWAFFAPPPLGWIVAALVTLVAVAGVIVKYLIPGRRLKDHGLPTSYLLIALAVAIVGFFVIPVAGAFIGFVLAIYILETRRVGRERAWGSTMAALKAIALSVGIELAAGFIMVAIWVAAVILG